MTWLVLVPMCDKFERDQTQPKGKSVSWSCLRQYFSRAKVSWPCCRDEWYIEQTAVQPLAFVIRFLWYLLVPLTMDLCPDSFVLYETHSCSLLEMKRLKPDHVVTIMFTFVLAKCLDGVAWPDANEQAVLEQFWPSNFFYTLFRSFHWQSIWRLLAPTHRLSESRLYSNSVAMRHNSSPIRWPWILSRRAWAGWSRASMRRSGVWQAKSILGNTRWVAHTVTYCSISFVCKHRNFAAHPTLDAGARDFPSRIATHNNAATLEAYTPHRKYTTIYCSLTTAYYSMIWRIIVSQHARYDIVANAKRFMTYFLCLKRYILVEHWGSNFRPVEHGRQVLHALSDTECLGETALTAVSMMTYMLKIHDAKVDIIRMCLNF